MRTCLFMLLYVCILVSSPLLSGCGGGKRINVNYETTQTVIVDDAKRTKAAGEAFVGIAEAFFAERYNAPASHLKQKAEEARGYLPPEEPPCDNCGGGFTPTKVDTPTEAVVYLGEDEATGEVVPQRIEFQNAASLGVECTADSPCAEYADSPKPVPPRKKKLGEYAAGNRYPDPFGGVTAQIQNNVGTGASENLLLQYLLDEKRSQREQRYASERTKQFAALLDKMAEVMNKPSQHEPPSE